MITINLLPDDLKKKAKGRIKLDFPVARYCGIFLGVFILAQLAALGYFVVLNNQLTDFKKQNVKLTEQFKQIADKKAQVAEYESKIKKLWDIFWARFRWCRVLNSITESVPRGLWLKYFYIKDVDPAPGTTLPQGKTKTTALILEGTVSAQGQEAAYVGKFIKELKANSYFVPMFSNVGLSKMIQRKIKNTDVFDFTVICFFKEEYLPL